MSLLSLERYLYGGQKQPPPPAARPEAPPGGHFTLSQNILASISRFMAADEESGDLAEQTSGLGAGFCHDTSANEIQGCIHELERLLEEYRDRQKRREQERAEDFRKVLALLNEAFSHLTAGSERSDSRFKRLETSLSTAAKSEDIRTLKAQLSEVLQFVRQQSEQESQHAQGALKNLGEQMRQVHSSASQFGSSLQVREQAIARLTESIRNEAEGTCKKVYATLFVADALTALRSRHGNQIADGLLEDLSRKDIAAILPEATIFRWGANGLLATWQSDADLSVLTSHVAAKSKAPFDHRAFVGTRVAVFSIPVRSVTMKISSSLSELVPNLDRFEGGGSGLR